MGAMILMLHVVVRPLLDRVASCSFPLCAMSVAMLTMRCEMRYSPELENRTVRSERVEYRIGCGLFC
jgi:hypothetical protein